MFELSIALALGIAFGVLGTLTFWNLRASKDDDNYDGAPYCSYGHRTKESCTCGPIADSE